MDYKNMFSLEGKGIVVAGGSGYLGSEIVKGLQDFGGKVVIADLQDVDADKKISGGYQHQFIKCDFNSTESVRKMYAEAEKTLGSIDVLFNCAAYSGYAGTGTAQGMSDETWTGGIEGTLGFTFRCTREAYPYMEKNHKGSIINFGSLYAVGAPDFRTYEGTDFISPPNYGAGKAAIVQLTRHCASQFAKNGIRVNSISPGSYPHPKTQEHKMFSERLANKTMLGRIGMPADLVGIAVLLASDASSYITGANYMVDGGQTAW